MIKILILQLSLIGSYILKSYVFFSFMLLNTYRYGVFVVLYYHYQLVFVRVGYVFVPQM